MATLRITTGPAQGQSIECNREVVIGREGVDLVIDDEEASRRHAAVRPGPGGIEVEDLGSLNGTFVDGARIGGVTTLRSSAKLRIGRTEFALEGAAADLPVADPQRTVASATPVSDVGERTRVRDQPVVDVPDRTVVRDTPVIGVPDRTVVRETPPPSPEPVATPAATGTPGASPDLVATLPATTVRPTVPAPPAGAPPSTPGPSASGGAAPAGKPSRASSGPPVRLIVPLVVIAIVAVVVLLLTHVI